MLFRSCGVTTSIRHRVPLLHLTRGWPASTVAQSSRHGVRRSAVSTGPLWIRGRLTLGLCQDFVKQTFRDSQVSHDWSGGRGQITLGHSVFCVTREAATHALCGFYVSALRAILAAVGMTVTTEVSTCRATGGSTCVLSISPVTDRKSTRLNSSHT